MELKSSTEVIFYGEIIPEAIDGKIFATIPYSIGFNTTILKDGKEIKHFSNETYPTLMIKDEKQFLDTLSNYTRVARNYYNEFENDDIDIADKSIMSLVWANATSYDFNNPIMYLNRLTNFITDKTFDEYSEPTNFGYSELLECDIEILVRKEKAFLETPYALEIKMTNGDLYFQLPIVRFGIDKNIGYIYAIQNSKRPYPTGEEEFNKAMEKFHKKVKRSMYEVNEGFVDAYEGINNIENPENLTGITPTTLLSLTVIMSLFKKHNITKIKAPDYLPIRWQSHEAVDDFKVYMVEPKERDTYRQQLDDEHNKIMQNMVDKYIRTFRRLDYHFDGMEITSLPKEVDDFLHLDIDNELQCNNQLLGELYSLINNKQKKR